MSTSCSISFRTVKNLREQSTWHPKKALRGRDVAMPTKHGVPTVISVLANGLTSDSDRHHSEARRDVRNELCGDAVVLLGLDEQ